MKRNLLLIVVYFSCIHASAQKHRPAHVSIALTTLHTAFPFGSFGKLFTEEFHPGFEVGTGFNWRTKIKHDWFQTFHFGYSYHRFVQHSLVLYSETGYRYKFLKTFAAEAKLGAGYMHAIPVGKIFKLKEDGSYKKKTNLGRPQVMAGFSLGIKKEVAASGLKVFIQYQQRVQFPFIKSYVPFLPANIAMAGVEIPLKQKTTRNKN